MRKRIVLVVLTLVALVVVSAAQQDKSKRPSPPAKASCKLTDGKTITVDYSSPRAKGRKIFGDLVPYGKVWRTGANESTALTTDADLMIGGKDVPAGSYTIFTVPGENKWTLVISKKTGEWGTDYPGESNDLARLDMTASPLSAPAENFLIAFDTKGSSCTMRLEWEKTRASVDLMEKK